MNRKGLGSFGIRRTTQCRQTILLMRHQHAEEDQVLSLLTSPRRETSFFLLSRLQSFPFTFSTHFPVAPLSCWNSCFLSWLLLGNDLCLTPFLDEGVGIFFRRLRSQDQSDPCPEKQHSSSDIEPGRKASSIEQRRLCQLSGDNFMVDLNELLLASKEGFTT